MLTFPRGDELGAQTPVAADKVQIVKLPWVVPLA